MLKIKFLRIIFVLILFFQTSFFVRACHDFMYPAKDEDYAKVIKNWKEVLTGGDKSNKKDKDIKYRLESISSDAERNWSTMDKAMWRSYLWKDLSNAKSSDQTIQNLERIKSLALAYSTPNSSVWKNKKLKNDIVFAFNWIYKSRYNENENPLNSKEWNWEIRIPLIINDVIVLMYEDLSKDERLQYNKVFEKFSLIREKEEVLVLNNSEDGNYLVNISIIYLLSGAIAKDPQKMESGRDILGKAFKYVKEGDGFYEDGSFLCNKRVPYNGGHYSLSLMSHAADILYLVKGTKWEISKSHKEMLLHRLLESYEPFIYKGVIMDMVRGREIAQPANDLNSGHDLIKACVRLSPALSSESSIKLIQLIKHWIISDSLNGFYKSSSLNIINLCKQIASNNSIKSEELLECKIYPQMDRALIKRPRYVFGISLFSDRICNYESVNNENLKGWYTSYGMTYLYNEDLNHYKASYWPTVNPQRLPGTTITGMYKALADLPGRSNKKSWVGGTEILGLYGAVGMDLEDVGSTLEGKKSWFLFDDEIVALGAGIKCKEKQNVESIIENRKIDSDSYTIIMNGRALIKADLNKKIIKGAEWIHLKGSSSQTGIGYYFPKYYGLNLAIDDRKGSWSSINKNISDSLPYSQSYFTLWFNHGTSPKAATYQYIMLPVKNAEQTKEYDKNPDVVILQNNLSLQAAKEKTLNLIAANFWNDENTILSVDANFVINCDKKASILIIENKGEMEIAISDPTQLNEGFINIELVNKEVIETIFKDHRVTVTKNEVGIKIAVNVKGSLGKTYKARFKVPLPEIEN